MAFRRSPDVALLAPRLIHRACRIAGGRARQAEEGGEEERERGWGRGAERGVEDGAQGPLLLACDPQLQGVSGRYWKETSEKTPSSDALDEDLAGRLWEESCRLTGLSA